MNDVLEQHNNQITMVTLRKQRHKLLLLRKVAILRGFLLGVAAALPVDLRDTNPAVMAILVISASMDTSLLRRSGRALEDTARRIMLLSLLLMAFQVGGT